MARDLDIQFKEAVEKVSTLKQGLAPDIMLKLYAYYKQATSGNNFIFNNNGESDVINAFKFNAWMQLNGMPEDEAKQEYINLVNKILS
jgi:acyl-CoA-binding protein